MQGSTVAEDEARFQSAAEALTMHFQPEKNVTYHAYVLRQATQDKEELIDECQTRSPGLAKHCEFVQTQILK